MGFANRCCPAKKPVQCERCFKEEAVGMFSAREYYTDLYPILDEAVKNTNDDGSTNHRIQYIDLRLGNLCNLRCRMCNPYTSKKLVKESLELNLISKSTAKFLHTFEYDNKNLWNFLNKYLEEIDTIYLTGGEPTLITEQFVLLSRCIEKNLAKNITLKYNTNITNIPNKFFDYWKEFKIVKLNCSVDGVGRVNEYIRNPSDWRAIDKNLQKIEKYLIEHPNWRSQIHTTVQIYNITHLIDLFEYFRSYKRIVNFPTLNILNTPPYFCVKALPASLKAVISNELLEWFKRNLPSYEGTPADRLSRIRKIPKLIEFMNAEDWSQQDAQFKFYTEFYDKSRNEDFVKISPKLKKWYNSIH